MQAPAAWQQHSVNISSSTAILTCLHVQRSCTKAWTAWYVAGRYTVPMSLCADHIDMCTVYRMVLPHDSHSANIGPPPHGTGHAAHLFRRGGVAPTGVLDARSSASVQMGVSSMVPCGPCKHACHVTNMYPPPGSNVADTAGELRVK